MNTPKILAVAFDMDGLMLNTEDLYDQVGEMLLVRRGQSFTNELKMKMMGLPGPAAFEVMRQYCGLVDSYQTVQQEADEIFADLLPAEIAMLPGLETLLDLLEGQGIPKAIATSSFRNFASRALSFFELEPRFEFVLTADDVVNGKPHPEIYQTAARRLDVPPAQMLVLEDSFHGSTAAARAGAYTIAVPTVHSQHQDFSHVSRLAKSLNDPVILELFQQ